MYITHVRKHIHKFNRVVTKLQDDIQTLSLEVDQNDPTLYEEESDGIDPSRLGSCTDSHSQKNR